MEVVVDRDSVSMGDDCDPHAVQCTVPGEANLATLLGASLRACPLASIAGGRATWFAEVGPRRHVVAVVAQQWDAPRWVVDPRTPAGALLGTEPRVMFRYWCQADPEAVHAALLGGTELPPKYG